VEEGAMTSLAEKVGRRRLFAAGRGKIKRASTLASFGFQLKNANLS